MSYSDQDLQKPINKKDVFEEPQEVKNALILQILNVVGFVAVVIVNALNSTGFIGDSNGEISDRYPTKITPEGYTFSVWGLIYFFCAAFTLYQALPSQRKNKVIFERIHILFFLSSVFNFIWSLIFPYDEIWASAIIISCILISLLAAYHRIGIGMRDDYTLTEFFLVHVTFSIYSAWLCVATVVNYSVALSGKSGWYGEPWTEEGWAYLMISVLSAVVLFILITRKDGAFSAIFAWAVFGIGSKDSGSDNYQKFCYGIGGIFACLSVIALIVKFYLRARGKSLAL